MYALFERYYDGVTYAQFQTDFTGKSHVIELRDDDGLRGFSTVALIEFTCDGVTRRAIFSGDTIIDHRYWGEQALPLAFCRFAGEVHAAQPDTPLYWFLISKGYRTYRYLPIFSREYYPRRGVTTPTGEQACLDQLAHERFGAHYDATRGTLHFPVSHGHLKPEWADVRDTIGTRPDVRFFLERNPGYRNGDELVCLTRLIPGNLRSYARRAFLQGMNDFAYSEQAGLLSTHRRERSEIPLAIAASAGNAAASAAAPAAA